MMLETILSIDVDYEHRTYIQYYRAIQLSCMLLVSISIQYMYVAIMPNKNSLEVVKKGYNQEHLAQCSNNSE